LVRGTLEVSSVGNNSKVIQKESELEMTIYNEDEAIAEESKKADENVQVNYLRVRGADLM